MSTMEYKAVFRARLPRVTDEREHLAWMREHLGEEPVELDEWKNGVWFTYGRRQCNEPYLKECSWEGEYGVELILMHVTEELGEGLALTEEEFLGHLKRLRDLVGEGVPIKFFSYSWYNGVEEPIEW